MKNDYDLRHWLALTLIRPPDPSRYPLGTSAAGRKLLEFFESPGAVLRARESDMRKALAVPDAELMDGGMNSDEAKRALEWIRLVARGPDPDEVERALKWAAADGNAVATIMDEAYPQRLLSVRNPPLLLYVRGDLSALSREMVAVVGSRSASRPGMKNAEVFARALSDAGVAVASGLALGIDSAAHRGALAGKAGTVAVLAGGADALYPKENRELASAIMENGALVTEYPLGAKALHFNFPHRNRVISGLSRAVLVVEAARKSGSLITAKLALEQGRDVFAVPGSINSPMHKGCHALIKQGAKLAENVDDILSELDLFRPPPSFRAADFSSDGDDARNGDGSGDVDGRDGEDGDGAGSGRDGDDAVLSHIDFEPTTLDGICARSGMPASELTPVLLDLELSGKIETLPGGKYQRLR